jgi:capsular exopolysaccharide synthesis family protein
LTAQPDNTFNLEEVLRVIRRRLIIVVLLPIVVAAATYAVSRSLHKEYTATASLVFNGNQLSQEIAGVNTNSPDPTVDQQTNLQLLTLGGTAAETAQIVGRGLTSPRVASAVTASSTNGSNVVTLSATLPSPTLASLVANTYARLFVNSQSSQDHRSYVAAETLVTKELKALSPQQRAGPQGLALQDRAQTLAILSHLGNSNVQLAQAATAPTAPSSPRTSRNTVVAFGLGLLLTIGGVLLLERLDRRIRDPADLERLYRLPLLGTIPASRAFSRETSGGGSTTLQDADIEPFRMLRAHLRYFNVDRDLRTIAIVSAAPEDGKTTVTRYLAEAIAAMGSSVLVVETDLRRGALANRLGLTAGPGLAGVLIGAATPAEAIQTVTGTGQPTAQGTYDVLLSGAVRPPNPAELIESHVMANLIREMRDRYDVVLLDTAPLTVVSDGFPLLAQVDGVVIVGRVGRNERHLATRLRDVLVDADAPLLGVVANAVRRTRAGGYTYDYNYVAGPGDESTSANGSTASGPLASSSGRRPSE